MSGPSGVVTGVGGGQLLELSVEIALADPQDLRDSAAMTATLLEQARNVGDLELIERGPVGHDGVDRCLGTLSDTRR